MTHVVVIGGGIVGLATAHYLRERQIEATVVEKDTIGSGNTERALGGIRAQFSSPANVRLSLTAFEVWECFESEFGVDIGYERHGYMFLTDDASTVDRFERDVAVQNDLGVPSEILDPAAAAEIVPGLDPTRFAAAAYSPTDGAADPHLALQGFYRAALEGGASIETGTEVIDIRREDDRDYTVETDEGPYRADWVVNAAGAWGRQVAAMAGIDLPVEPKRRTIAVVSPHRPVPESTPLVADLDTGVYFSPDTQGDALVGGQLSETDPPADPDDYRGGYEIDWLVDVLGILGSWCDRFGPETEIRDGWSGLYAMTPDRNPIIEETRPRFVNAVGFSGHGFMHAPAVGQLIAELVDRGETEVTDLSAFRSDRFDLESVGERNVV